jgi:hypothetical protein
MTQDTSWNQMELGLNFSEEVALSQFIESARIAEEDAWMVANEDVWRDAFPFDDFDDGELPW